MRQMVLITPRVEVDPASPCGGKLVVSFPEDADLETFSIPLYPTEQMLEDWHMYVIPQLQNTCSLLPALTPLPSQNRRLSHVRQVPRAGLRRLLHTRLGLGRAHALRHSLRLLRTVRAPSHEGPGSPRVPADDRVPRAAGDSEVPGRLPVPRRERGEPG